MVWNCLIDCLSKALFFCLYILYIFLVFFPFSLFYFSLSVDDEKLGRQSTSVTSESNQKPLYLCSTASSADANSDSSDRQIKGSSINATKTVDSSKLIFH